MVRGALKMGAPLCFSSLLIPAFRTEPLAERQDATSVVIFPGRRLFGVRRLPSSYFPVAHGFGNRSRSRVVPLNIKRLNEDRPLRGLKA
jgi:hypothetical protein